MFDLKTYYYLAFKVIQISCYRNENKLFMVEVLFRLICCFPSANTLKCCSFAFVDVGILFLTCCGSFMKSCVIYQTTRN